MSDFSRSRFTITLGRTGQVVKRDGSSFDDFRAGSKPLAGGKRPIRERLGVNGDSFEHLSNKRLRRDVDAVSAVDDIHLSKDDLRHKIMQKKNSRNSQFKGLDLRNVLSRPTHSSTNRPSTWKNTEPREVGSHYSESKDGRNYSPEPRGTRQFMPTKSSNQHFPASGGQISREQYLAENRNSEQINYEPRDIRRQVRDVPRSSMASGIPPPRSSNILGKMEQRVDSLSPRSLDHLRRKSRDEALATSRAHLAPLRDKGSPRRFSVLTSDGARSSVHTGKEAYNFSRPESPFSLKLAAPGYMRDEGSQRRYSIRGSDGARTGAHVGKEFPEFSRSTSPSYLSKMATPGSMRDEGSQRRYSVRGSDAARTNAHTGQGLFEFSRSTSPPYLSRPSPPVGLAKTMAPLVSASARSLPTSRGQNSSYMNSFDVEVNDHSSVDIFLRSLDLEKYSILFKAEEVDMYSLTRMNEDDLKAIGIPMGPRRKIVLSLNSRLKRHD